MDYSALSAELIVKLYELSNTCLQKRMGESLKGEMLLLQSLLHRGGSSLPGELSEAMSVSSARITAVLNSLAKKGYVERKPDCADRRKKVVSITEAGLMCASRHRQYLGDILAGILTELGEEDAKEYIRIIGRIIEISETQPSLSCFG